ncbi:MAG: histidine kinase [Anaerolineae bacterium]|nr:MAG: histidine kinase [Anaerolineae bacterium]
MYSSSQPHTTLLCTLGGKPRIVTLTLDLLLARGESIDQVIVVYPGANPRYREAYQRLLGEFAGNRYFGRTIRLRGVPVRMGEQTLREAFTPAQVNAVWGTFQRTISELKAENQQVHLSLSGGRRILALVAFSVATAYFTSGDYVWHIYTPDAVSAALDADDLLHAPPGSDVRLIAVPFTPWVSHFPGLQPLLARTPAEQRAYGLDTVPDADERARCRDVWERLTPAQRNALRALCATSTRQQAAGQLGISVYTLDDHKREIYRHCKLAWQDEKIDQPFLQRKFRGFLKYLDEV